MKDKSYGVILRFDEASQLGKDLNFRVFLPNFETWANTGLFDGWVHVWRFENKEGEPYAIHYWCTDAYNVFN